MKRSLKHLLLWCLIAVLPLQGFAAVMLHGWTIAAPVVDVVAMPSMHHAMPMAMPSHEACMETPADGDASHHGAKHGCSASAACCVGAAVPPGFLSLRLPLDSPEVHQAWVIAPVAGHIPDGLERPPKFSTI